MKIFPISDVHLESSKYQNVLAEIEPDKDVVCVVAGDISSWIRWNHARGRFCFASENAQNLQDFIDRLSEMFKAVVIVLGNHDHNGLVLEMSHPEDHLQNVKPRYDFPQENVYTLHAGSSVQIDGVTFVGCTMWTDVNGGDPIMMILGGNALKVDFGETKVKRSEGGEIDKFQPRDWAELHRREKELLRKFFASREEDSGQVVVVTHMPPSKRSLHPSFSSDAFNGFFQCSDMDEFAGLPALWIHGHTHNAFDYDWNGTRVVCNPRGYGKESVRNGYDSQMRVEI